MEKFLKIILLFLVGTIVVLGIEGAWYWRIRKRGNKVKKSLSKEPETNKEWKDFDECFISENADTKGFLVNAFLMSYSSNDEKFILKCGNKRFNLYVNEDTRYLIVSKPKKQLINNKIVYEKKYLSNQEFLKEWFNKGTGIRASINIYKFVDKYNARTIAVKDNEE